MRRADLLKKDIDAGKDWGQEEKGATEDEMVGWHHQLDGLEFEARARSWWWTGRPGMWQSIGSQRGGHNLVMEKQQINRCFLWLSNTKYNVLSDKNNYWEHWHDFQEGTKVHEPMVCAFLTSPTSSLSAILQIPHSSFQYRQHRMLCETIMQWKYK